MQRAIATTRSEPRPRFFVANQFTTVFADRLRFVEVPDDHLEPTVRRLDYVLIAPVAEYRGEGIYLLRNGFGEPASFRAEGSFKAGDRSIRLWCENAHYSAQQISPDEFAARVIGKAVMTCRVQDTALLRDHFATAA